MLDNRFIKSSLRTISSALRYEEIDVSEEDYETTDFPFKGLHINEEGDVNIQGVDGESAVVHLLPGTWPYGGIGILSEDTTSTNIVVLF